MISRRTFIHQTSLATTGIIASGILPASARSSTRGAADDLRADIQKLVGMLRIPGLLAAVVQDGKIIFSQAEGFADLEKKTPMTKDAIFPVASVTKTLAAVIMAQYEEEGKASFDDFVLDYPFLVYGLTPERLPDPNVRIWHALSHTSEGEPGTNYLYNGNRYNLASGVYEKAGGVSSNPGKYIAFAEEVTKRIIQPLKLKHTYPGYPQNPGDDAEKIVTTYTFDIESKQFSVRDKNEAASSAILYTSNNLYTCLDDLVKYTTALDRNELITAKSYQRLTTPIVSPNGRISPYGIGWSTQTFEEKAIHWHYGYGNGFAALLVRVPSLKLSFILFSNAVPASETFQLGYGNLLNSPFAASFLNRFVAQKEITNNPFAISKLPTLNTPPLFFDMIFSQAQMRYYMERKFNTNQGEAITLLNYLATEDPGRFEKLDIALMDLMLSTASPTLQPYLEKLIGVYQQNGYFHPGIHLQIVNYYKQTGDQQNWLFWLHLLADSKGFEEQGGVKTACTRLGDYYQSNGDIAKGRQYIWKAALYSRYMGGTTADVERYLKLMKGNR